MIHWDKKQGFFQQHFTVVGTVMSKFMYIYISHSGLLLFWDVCNVLFLCLDVCYFGYASLFKNMSWFCCVWHVQILRFIGLVTTFWQVLQLVARLPLCLEIFFVWKDHCNIEIIPFFVINNFIVVIKNSSEISIQSLTSHNLINQLS